MLFLVSRGILFGVGRCNVLVLECFEHVAIFGFWEIQVILKRTHELAVDLKRRFYSGVPEKDILQQWSRVGPFGGRCSESTAAVAWAWMTAVRTGAGLGAQ